MEHYLVTGMSCAACQARVEKAVSKVEGVTSCSVSLLTNTMGVEGTADPQAIIDAVTRAGYGAGLMNEKQNAAGDATGDAAAREPAEGDEASALEDRETPLLLRRLWSSVLFLIPLMYLSMGHMMLHLPLPEGLAGNAVGCGILQMLFSGIVMLINRKFFVSGGRSLLHGAPNMDTLIALGSSASWLYSMVMLLAASAALTSGDPAKAAAFTSDFYFETAAMILTLITVGKTLESWSKGKTTSALRGLLDLAPKTAVLLVDGVEKTVPVREVRVGDIFVVRPGEAIPVDGVIISGESAVGEAAITGESIPVDKGPGDPVTSATLNRSGFLTCRAERVGEDTTISQIIHMVRDASATKAPVARLADRISSVFVPAVLGIAALTFVIWMFLGAEAGEALARGVCVLVVSCPCALGLATPVAIMVGNGVGARNGILFKTAEALQETGRIRTVVLDKTGTVTTGEPSVCGVFPAGTFTEEQLLSYAASLEKKSEHPLAGAVVSYGEAHGIRIMEVEDFRALTGSGVEARIDGSVVVGGRENLIRERVGEAMPKEVLATAGQLTESGKTIMFFALDGKYLGMIAVADPIRPDSRQAIGELRKAGIRTVLLTGDRENTAKAIAKEAGIDEVTAEVFPDGKAAVIGKLKDGGKVAMIGDGINDAPALSSADIGIAVGAGTDIAIDAADVVLMKNSLMDAVAAIRLSRKTFRNIVENLFWALIYNCALIPAAAGVFSGMGIRMSPMLGALAMSLSSFCVVMNALRLNLVNIRGGRTAENRQKDTEKDTEKEAVMTKTIRIEGMMCAHCENTVKKALEAVQGVSAAEVSHEKGNAVVTLGDEVTDDLLRQAVEDKDYKVLGID